MSNLSMIGAGYVGLVSGAMFANMGHRVVCCDVDAHKTDALNNGIVPIYEEGLADIIRAAQKRGLLSFTTDAGILQFRSSTTNSI